MIKYNKIFFSLLEIIIAIALLGIGVTSIMALFPLGLNITKNSIAQNYSATEAENIFAYLSAEAHKNWNILASIDDDTKPKSVFGGIIKWDVDVKQEGDSDIWDDTVDDGVYVFKVQSATNTDMTGEILLWKKKLYNYAVPPETMVNASGVCIAYGVYMEISWPLHVQYSNRKKNIYYIELVNKN